MANSIHITPSISRRVKIKEEIDDKKGIGTSLNGIAGIYYLQGNLDKAMEFYLKSTKILNKLSSLGYTKVQYCMY